LGRLKAAGRIVSPRRGFYVVVPLQYRATGAPPAAWFIDDLMRFLGQPYYVGLLSAAALHGAAHQRPQVFQVMTTAPTRPVAVGRVRIEFLRKRGIEEAATEHRQTETGTMVVATPETTLFDLLRHLGVVGTLNSVATVVAELGEVIDAARLERAARLAKTPEVQRAGYLCELTGQEELALVLERHLQSRRVRRTLLRPDRSGAGQPWAARWSLILNDVVEPDP
jgi:predicted transcriptional regulator of viral defense system